MKKFFTLLFSLLTLIAYAQGDCVDMIRIQFHDGTHKDYYIEEVDEIDFICSNQLDCLNGYEYVDLGLPSGLLWATCNVGATKPEEYGHFYAWAETSVKDIADFAATNTAYFAENRSNGIYYSKYNIDPDGEYYDGLATLEPMDDAASVNWGGCWRMPTQEEFNELKDNTNWTYVNDYENTGIAGMMFFGKKEGYTDKYIFLPAAGFTAYGENYKINSEGYYWTSSSEKDKQNSIGASLYLSSGSNPQPGIYIDYWYRSYGYTVRPVASKSE